jgi:uncharacterized protein YjbJ (UPF0337 family)
MNWDAVTAKWERFRGEARRQWGKLSDEDLDYTAGEKERLIGKLQERYGWTPEQAEQSAEECFDGLVV